MLVQVRALCGTCIVYELDLISCILCCHAGSQDLVPEDEVGAEPASLVQIQWKQGLEILLKPAAHHWQGKALMGYHSLLVNESQRIQSPGRKDDLSAETLPPQPRLAHTCTGTLAQHRASGHPYRACFDVSIHIFLTIALIWDSQKMNQPIRHLRTITKILWSFEKKSLVCNLRYPHHKTKKKLWDTYDRWLHGLRTTQGVCSIRHTYVTPFQAHPKDWRSARHLSS